MSGWKGLAFDDTGYVTLAAEYKDQERTERSGYDFRQQYPLVGGTGAQTIIDLEGRFEPTGRLRIALGAENLLDAFPVARNATGNTPFSNYAPFGRSGRYLYGRGTYGF